MSCNLSDNELACVWASMVEISDRHKEILFSIAEPEFLIENLEMYKEEIEQEIGEKGYNEHQKISMADVVNFVEKITRQNIKIITKFSDEYPESLFDLNYPPLVLYCVGDELIMNVFNVVNGYSSRNFTCRINFTLFAIKSISIIRYSIVSSSRNPPAISK